jgi:hypothetical protein
MIGKNLIAFCFNKNIAFAFARSLELQKAITFIAVAFYIIFYIISGLNILLIFRSPIIFGLVVMVLNATFNNITVISWQSVLVVKETGVPGENHRSAASH